MWCCCLAHEPHSNCTAACTVWTVVVLPSCQYRQTHTLSLHLYMCCLLMPALCSVFDVPCACCAAVVASVLSVQRSSSVYSQLLGLTFLACVVSEGQMHREREPVWSRHWQSLQHGKCTAYVLHADVYWWQSQQHVCVRAHVRVAPCDDQHSVFKLQGSVLRM